MILLKLDQTESTPLYIQIYTQIIQLIEGGALKIGAHLHSSRALAGSLGVNR